jgi:RNA recognition motif-containing protein
MEETHQLTRRGPQRSLFVRPIGPDTRPDELKAEFSLYGNVRDVHIPCDFKTRTPRGFAYVE